MKLSIAVAVGAWLCAAAVPAFAGPLSFDFTFSGESAFPGTVSGEVEGLTNNATSPAAALFITSATIALPFSSTFNITTNANVLNSFTVANDVITSIDFYANDASTFAFVFGSAESEVKNQLVNFLTGDQIYSPAGLSGIKFTLVSPSVPEPAALALFAAGLIGLGLIRWRKPTHAAS